jgi:hypothetical protein
MPIRAQPSAMADPSSSIVIVGAGAGGLACALTAAARGLDVVLLEEANDIGGTVAHALIHTLGGLFDDQAEILNPGLTEELIARLSAFCSHTAKRRIGKTWTLSVDPAVYLRVVQQWIREHPRIHVHRQATINKVSADFRGVHTLVYASQGEVRTLRPSVFIDASGRGATIKMLKNDLVSEGQALAGLIVQIRGVDKNAFQFPNSVSLLHTIRKAADAGRLPPECNSIWLDQGVTTNEAYIKFNLEKTHFNSTHMTHVAVQLLTYLQDLPAFADAYISAIGRLGIRDDGQVHGDYVLTESDIREGRVFEDSVCQACWPIEYWHPQNGVRLHYFPPGHRYQIPLRSLKVKGYENTYVVGKCFSAEPMALASARVAGTCWAMGEGLIQSLYR